MPAFKHFVLAIALALVLFLSYLTYYVGLFKPVILNEETAGPFWLLSQEHLGAYHKIVPVIESVENWAKAQGLRCRLSFGLYLDDPTRVEESRLKSKGGCIIDEGEVLPNNLPKEMKIEQWETRRVVRATFEGAPSIGPFRVYPKAMDYLQEKRNPTEKNIQRPWNVLETYEIFGKKEMRTTYYFSF